MANKPTESLLTRFQGNVQREAQPVSGLVPIEDFAFFYLVTSEIARMGVGEGGTELQVFVDGQTAAQVDAVDGLRAAAARVYLFGKAPGSWTAADNIRTYPFEGREQDLFLAVLSPRLSLMMVGEQREGGTRGVWTGVRDHVHRLIRQLFAKSGTPCPPLGEKTEGTPEMDRTLDSSMYLMEILVRQLALRQRDIAMDKDDLSSVLNILKAVSVKRHAHDILYIFVQQIARAVRMTRCSVVQVWGGDHIAHVLASHEDERVVDLPIDLRKYPEIRRAMDTRQKVVINDARRDPLTRVFFEKALPDIDSILVIPVVLFDEHVGSFLLRAARSQDTFSLREINFCEIVAEAAANALERAQLFESIQKANERLELLAVTDGLTGLYNHRFLRQRFEEEFERAKRYALPLSCLIADVDDFKRINDTYGHLQGDAALRKLSAVMLQSVRKIDVVTRYGGEEFFVIMPQTGLEGARAEAERIRKEIAGTFFDGMPDDYRVTVSIGVAIFDPRTLIDWEALIRVADSALYQAKHEGKNRVAVGKS